MKSKLKWLVASRNRPDMAERLTSDDVQMKISLQLNAEPVTKAVSAFVDAKVQRLASQKKYEIALKEEVRSILIQNSEATFIWVAWACKQLERVPASEAQSILDDIQSSLDSVYERMVEQILREPSSRAEHYK